MNLPLAVVLVLGSIAMWNDLRSRVIPDWIPLVLLVTGLGLHAFAGGWQGLLQGLAGGIGGFFVFFVFFWLGGMGGGDIKLMGGFGAVLGQPAIWPAAFLAAVFGCLLALAIMAVRRLRHQEAGLGGSIPYAPAIVLGSSVVVWAIPVR